jgi:transcriptional regulator with XRE-family HTH domain
MQQRNVLRVNPIEEQTAFRNAVARVLTCIQANSGDTLLEIAERIGVSLGTISNAANKKNDLSPTFINRLGQAYGPEALDPIHALYGARGVPLDADSTADALPPLTASIHRLAVARSEASPGGERITHGELLEMEPEIDAAMKALTALKLRCNLIRSQAA